VPLTHTRVFRIRHYECDAYGKLSYATYLRYMQEAAFDASAAAGYGNARYAEMKRTWLIRESEVEYLCPLRYGDSAAVKTWVIDFRRIRSYRAYEFRRAGSDELVAQARTDWVFLDGETLHPVNIPREMMEGFFPEGPPEPAPPRERFPTPEEPPPGSFTARRCAEWRDIDPAQHVNNAIYLSYMVDGSIQAAGSYGWPVERMRTEGFDAVMRRCRIEYKQPAVLGDALEVATWMTDVQDAAFTRHFTVRRLPDEALLSRACTGWACVHVETGEERRFPPAFLSDMAPNIL
jgi:YbgC/YbaW family acyl-CoA thioester hydrolase